MSQQSQSEKRPGAPESDRCSILGILCEFEQRGEKASSEVYHVEGVIGSRNRQARGDGDSMNWSQSEHGGLYQTRTPHRGRGLRGRILTAGSYLWAFKEVPNRHYGVTWRPMHLFTMLHFKGLMNGVQQNCRHMRCRQVERNVDV